MKKILITIALILLQAQLLSAKTTISWWQFWTDPSIKPVIEEIIQEFEKQNQDIEVDLTDLTWANGHEKIVIAFASGTGPDVVELGSDWIAEFAVNGHLAEYQMDDASQKDYYGWEMATFQKKVYAKPWFLGTRVLFANGDLLSKAGYEESFAPVTFNQFREAVYKVDSLSKKIDGFGSNAPEKHRLYKKYLPFFWSFGAQIFSDDKRLCLLASDYAVKALQFYKELHDSCGYVANQRGIEDAFLDGKVGFVISGDWLLKRIENEKLDFNLVSTLIPGDKYPGKSFLGGEFLAINNKSKNKEAAQKFIDFITSPENQVKFCKANRSANPSSKIATKDDYFTSNVHLQTFIKQLQLASHPPVDPNWVVYESIIEKAVEDAIFGDVSPATSLLNARKKIEALR